jgi:hypothetical protein
VGQGCNPSAIVDVGGGHFFLARPWTASVGLLSGKVQRRNSSQNVLENISIVVRSLSMFQTKRNRDSTLHIPMKSRRRQKKIKMDPPVVPKANGTKSTIM